MLAVRRAGIAVLAAVLLAGAGFLIVAVAKAGDATRQAAVQSAPVSAKAPAEEGRLEAVYTATISGIPIGRGNWMVEISDDQYTVAASGATTGIIKFFTGAQGTSAVHGTVHAGQPIPTSYGATITYDRKVDDVRIALTGGNVTDYAVEPPPVGSWPPAPTSEPKPDERQDPPGPSSL